MIEKNYSQLSDLKTRSNIIYLEVAAYYLISLSCIITFVFLYTHTNVFYWLPTYVVFVAIIGWCQFSISNAMHEAIHKNFGKTHNELLASFLTAYPIGFTMAYRNTHLDHHKYFGDRAKDPDNSGYSDFPKSKMAFIKRILYNLSGLPAIKQFLTEMVKKKEGAKNNEFAKLVVTQMVIIGISTLCLSRIHVLAGLVVYIILWIAPLVTVSKMLSTTRLLCEHGSPDNELVFRTITGNFFQTNSLGAFRFNYHAEHHIIPYIPYTNLKKAKEVINSDTSNYGVRYEEYNYGYLNLLLKWFYSLPLTNRR